LLDRFLSDLTVETEGSSRLIRISFTSIDPAKAVRIANMVVIDPRLASSTASWCSPRRALAAATARYQQVQAALASVRP
jgi:uncharacterized protein involved in exopolysaccharide biosynthesis